jgi:hypothetical protein
MSPIVTIGIDLAKNVFAVHGMDATGKLALMRPSAHRAKLNRARMSEPALSAMSGHSSKGKAVAQRWRPAAAVGCLGWADWLNGSVGRKKDDRTKTHHHFKKRLQDRTPMALVCKPGKRTKCHDKAKEHDLRRKIIDDKIKGGCGKPFVTKKVRAVEKVG